mgnify:FL=1|jgi:hypothetical protein
MNSIKKQRRLKKKKKIEEQARINRINSLVNRDKIEESKIVMVEKERPIIKVGGEYKDRYKWRK